MGFFSKLRQEIGKAISKVGEVLNSPAISRLGAKLENRSSEVAKIIGTSKAMNPSKASIEDSQRVNDTLATYARKVKDDSEELECAISTCMDSIHSILESAASNYTIRRRLNLDYASIRSNAKEIFTAHISRRISTADPKCVEIMKMRPSKKKEESMDAFTKKVTLEASQLAAESIKSALWNQNDQFKKEHDAKIENELFLLERSRKEIERIRNERVKLENAQSDVAPKCKQILRDAKSMLKILSPI